MTGNIGLAGLAGLSGMQSLYAQDPEQAAILRRQMLARELMRQAQQPRDMRHPMALYGSLAQSAAGALTEVLAGRDERELQDTRRAGEEAWLEGLRGGGAQPAVAQPGAAPSATPAVARQPLPPAPSGDDLDIAARVLIGEAGGEGPEGMAAAAAVIANRARLQGRSVRDVVTAPNQFEAWGARRQELMTLPPERVAEARRVLEGVMSGQTPDPTRGATHFLNPDLQRQLGRSQPAWAPEGQGTRIGRHVFYSRPEDFGGRRDPNAIPASAGGAPDVTPAAAAGGADTTEVPGMPGVTVGRLREAVVSGLASDNPRVRARAAQYAQVLQTMQRGEALRPVAPGSALVDSQGRVVGQIPQAPSDADRQLARWRELANRGEQRTPQETEEYNILSRRLRGGGTEVNVNNDRTFYGELAQQGARRIGELQGQAQSAVETVRQTREISRLLNSGTITGTGAQFREGLERALATAGLVDGDRVANTGVLVSLLARGTLDASGELRGPTSDRDISFLREVAGGRVELTADTIRRVARLVEDRATRTVNRYNDLSRGLADDPNIPQALRGLYSPIEIPPVDAAPAAGPGSGAVPPPPPGFRVVR